IVESSADPSTLYPAEPAATSTVLWSDTLETAAGGAADAGYAGSKFYQSAQGYPSGVAVKGGETPFNAGYVIDGDKSIFANSVGTTGFSWFTATNDSAAPILGNGSYVSSFLLKLTSPLESALYVQIRTWADEASDREKYPEYMISQSPDGTVSGSVAKTSTVGGGYEKIVINKVSDDLYSVSISFKTSSDITAPSLSDKWWIRMAFVDGKDAVAIDNITVYSTTEDPMYFPVAKPAGYMPPEASEVYAEDFEAAAGGPGDNGTSNGYIGSIFYGASNATLPGGVAVKNEPVVTSDFVIDGNKSAYFNGSSLTPAEGYFSWFVMTNDSAAPIAGDKTYLIRFLLKTVKPMPAGGALILHLRTWDDTALALAKYPEFTIRQDASGKLSATQANTSASDKIEIIRLDYDLYSVVMRVSTTTTDIAPVVANKWFVNFGVSKECTLAFDNFSVLQTSNTTEAAAYALNKPAGYAATNLANWSTDGTTPANAELLQTIDFESADGGGLGTEFVGSKCYYGRSGNSTLYTTIADKSNAENLIRGDMVLNGNKSASFVNRLDMDFSYWLQTVDNESVGGFKMPGTSCYVATFLLKLSRNLKYDEVNGSGFIFIDARTWADNQSAMFYLKPDASNNLVASAADAANESAPVPDNNEIVVSKLDSDLYAVSIKFTTAYTTSSFFDNWFFEFGTYKTGSYSVDDISFYKVNGEADPSSFLLEKPAGYVGQIPEVNVDEVPEETTTWVPMEDFDTGTVVEFIQEKLPEGITDVLLHVDPMSSGNIFDKFAAKATADDAVIQGDVLLLELLDQQEAVIETLDGGYKIKLVLPEGADPDKVKIYYYDPDTETVVEVSDVDVADGYASFSSATLGYFAYATANEATDEESNVESEEENPQTGDNNAIIVMMLISLAALAGIVIIRKRTIFN
ncbi:MAG: LPXTG cell wall anchor domain-containing protein, partial [Saccharofermentanales bacterium]